jgi:hypothetical protein
LIVGYLRISNFSCGKKKKKLKKKGKLVYFRFRMTSAAAAATITMTATPIAMYVVVGDALVGGIMAEVGVGVGWITGCVGAAV